MSVQSGEMSPSGAVTNDAHTDTLSLTDHTDHGVDVHSNTQFTVYNTTVNADALHKKLSFDKRVQDHYSSFGSYLDDKRKKVRLQYTAQYGRGDDSAQSSEQRHVLRGCVFWINGYVADIEAVKRIIYMHGGLVENVLVSGVTHIIAEQLPNTKIKELMHSRTPVVVLQYIYDCVKRGVMLDVADYITPELRQKNQSSVNQYFQPAESSTNTQKSSAPDTASTTSANRSSHSYVPRKMASPSTRNYQTIANFTEQAIGTAAVLQSDAAPAITHGRPASRMPARTHTTPPSKRMPALNGPSQQSAHTQPFGAGNTTSTFVNDSGYGKLQYLNNSMVSQMHKVHQHHQNHYVQEPAVGTYSQLQPDTGVSPQPITHPYHQTRLSVNDVKQASHHADITQYINIEPQLDHAAGQLTDAASASGEQDTVQDTNMDVAASTDAVSYDSDLEHALAAMQSQPQHADTHQPVVSDNEDALLRSPEKPTTAHLIAQSLSAQSSTYADNRISPIASNLAYVADKYHPSAQSARSTLNDPNFVANYFASSRLHFIGSFKEHINTIYPQLLACTPLYPAPSTSVPPLSDQHRLLIGDVDRGERVVLHVDMDCFFVSCSIRPRPDLVHKPVAVAHSTATTRSTAEISSCNYPARQYGLRAGMSIGKATEMCRELQVLDYDFQLYATVSEQIYKIFFSYTHCVQCVSCDEAYLEFPTWVQPHAIAERIKEDIYKATQCNASIGIGSNKLLARIATAHAKPNGIYELSGAAVSARMRDLNVAELPGVGYAIQRKLQAQLSVQTCAELQGIRLSDLQREFGEKTGAMLYETCRGVDNRPLESNKLRKSLGADVNYGVRFTDFKQVNKFIGDVATEVVQRLRHARVKGYSITVSAKQRHPDAPVEPFKFLGHGVCDNYTKTVNVRVCIDGSTDSITILTQHCIQLYNTFNIPPADLRGFGIHITKIESDTVIYNQFGLPINGKSNARGNSRGKNLSEMFMKQQAARQQAEHIPHTNEQTPDTRSIAQLNQHDLHQLTEQLSQLQSSSAGHHAVRVELSQFDGSSAAEPFQRPVEVVQQLQHLLAATLKQAGQIEYSALVAAMTVEQLGALQLGAAPANMSTGTPLIILIIPTHTNNTMQNADSDAAPPDCGITIHELPALSDLDRATVVELPLDIRKELAEAYKKRRALTQQQQASGAVERPQIPSAVPDISAVNQDVPTPAATAPTADSAVTVHTVQPVNVVQRAVRPSAGAPLPSINDLPEYDQLDADVLAALPADIRNELQRVYNQRKRNQLFEAAEQRQHAASKRVQQHSNQIVRVPNKQKRAGSARAVRVQSIAAHFNKLPPTAASSSRVRAGVKRTSLSRQLSEQAAVEAAIKASMGNTHQAESLAHEYAVSAPAATQSTDNHTSRQTEDINQPRFFPATTPPYVTDAPVSVHASTVSSEDELEDDVIELSDSSSVEYEIPLVEDTVPADTDTEQPADAQPSMYSFDDDVFYLSMTFCAWLHVVSAEQLQLNVSTLQQYCHQQITLYRNAPAVSTIIRQLRRHIESSKQHQLIPTFNQLLHHINNVMIEQYTLPLSIQPL